MKTIHILTIILLSVCYVFSAKAQDSFSLNGTWDVIFDTQHIGITEELFLDKNFSASDQIVKIAVPSCIEEYRMDYEGVVFYRKTFNIPADWEGSVINLNFDASNYTTDVWVNDQVVGTHEGGYTPFTMRIDKLIRFGEENTVIIRVVTPIILTDQCIDGMARQTVPSWRGAINGGIWQPITISRSGKLRINDIFIEPDIYKSSFKVNYTIENLTTEKDMAELVCVITDMDGAEICRKTTTTDLFPGKEKGAFMMEIPEARLWSPDSPYLYNCSFSVVKNGEVSDSWHHKTGLREFTVKDDQFYLNDKPIYLKACFFEGMYPVKVAYPDSREMAEREVMLAKECGFNMIRPWRKPAPKLWLDVCDSLGILTVGSLVVECMGHPIASPALPWMVENELTQTISKNRNRTCIVQWELFNEINRPILTQMLTEMSVLAREIDPSRMILDESGGFGLGANLYLPYQRTPTKFNDIHHYSGCQITDEEYDGYLATGQYKAENEKKHLRNTKGFGRNIVPGIMSYISEVGYGSNPDLVDNNRMFKEKGNPITPAYRYHKRLHEETVAIMKEVGFDKVFPDMTSFYREQQRMHGIANKRMIEALRSNPMIKGYCVHALADGDWVLGAGLIDFWRNPKGDAYRLTRKASGKFITPVRIIPRNIYADKGAELDITAISELKEMDCTYSISIVDRKGRTVYSKNVRKATTRGITKVLNEKLNTSTMKGSYEVKISAVDSKGRKLYEDSQSFDVYTKKAVQFKKSTVALYNTHDNLAEFLRSKGVEVIAFDSETPIATPVVFGKKSPKDSSYLTAVAAAEQFACNGGHVLFLDVLGETTPDFTRKIARTPADSLPFHAILTKPWATRSGWSAKSHIVKDHPVFKGLPTGCIMNGVYENVHPVTSMLMQEGEYIAGMIGYDHFPDQDEKKRGYIGIGDVWHAGDVVKIIRGSGYMIFSTLQLLNNIGKDPAADIILKNMIDCQQDDSL